MQAFPERFPFAASRPIIWQNLLVNIHRYTQALRDLARSIFGIRIDQNDFVQKRSSVCKFAGRALIGDRLAAEANFTAMIADPPPA